MHPTDWRCRKGAKGENYSHFLAFSEKIGMKECDYEPMDYF